MIGQIGTGGGIGHVIEYRGSAIREPLDGGADDGLQHVDRGRRPAGLVAPDDTTFAYLEGRPHAPQGAAWDEAVDDWRAAQRRRRAAGTASVRIDATTLRPQVTWGTNPGQVTSIDGAVPSPDDFADPTTRATVEPGARVHGPDTGHADARHRRRHRVHRLVHEQPHRGPAGRGRVCSTVATSRQRG